MSGANPVFRSIEARAHGVLGLGHLDRCVIVASTAVGGMASLVLAGVAATLTASLLLGLRRMDADRRDHLAIRARRRFGHRRYDPGRPDIAWVEPPTQ